MGDGPSRRDVLRTGIAGAGGLMLAPAVAGRARSVLAAGTPGKLSDIDHVVIVIQENRSFDHYFGYVSRGPRVL